LEFEIRLREVVASTNPSRHQARAFPTLSLLIICIYLPIFVIDDVPCKYE
jgi:hypothetical protein